MRVGVGTPASVCRGKLRYPSKAMAKSAISKIEAGRGHLPLEDGDYMSYYRCPFCRHIHIGKTSA